METSFSERRSLMFRERKLPAVDDQKKHSTLYHVYF